MITPRKCKNEEAVRRLLIEHGDEIVAEKQEVRIAWPDIQVIPARAVITGYQPEGSGEYADTLGVDIGNGYVYLISLDQITYFEVLATRLLTPEAAYRSMTEMTANLDSKQAP